MDNYIYISDENGIEHKMVVLFTFNANDKDYCIVHEEFKEDEVYAFIYNSDGSLLHVESEDELEMISEVLNSFDGVDDEA